MSKRKILFLLKLCKAKKKKDKEILREITFKPLLTSSSSRHFLNCQKKRRDKEIAKDCFSHHRSIKTQTDRDGALQKGGREIYNSLSMYFYLVSRILLEAE